MTIEYSLRLRAKQARWLATIWLVLTASVLVGTYASLPFIANTTLNAFGKIEPQATERKTGPTTDAVENKGAFPAQLYAFGTLALGLSAVGFACFLLGRAAFVEMELAARFSGFADALCIAGDNFEQLEKAANLLMPGTKYLSVPDMFSTKDLAPIVEMLKQLRPG